MKGDIPLQLVVQGTSQDSTVKGSCDFVQVGGLESGVKIMKAPPNQV